MDRDKFLEDFLKKQEQNFPTNKTLIKGMLLAALVNIVFFVGAVAVIAVALKWALN